ncbi:MAG TPA: restriction endonuclease [Tepidisphaeraceae bacterium]
MDNTGEALGPAHEGNEQATGETAAPSEWARIIAEEQAKPPGERDELRQWEATHFEECRLRALGQKRKYFDEKLAQLVASRKRAEAELRTTIDKEKIQFELLRATAIALATAHLTALLAQRRRKVFSDAYGRVIYDDWLNELRYFVSTTVGPKLDQRALENWCVACANIRRLALNCGSDGSGGADFEVIPAGEEGRELVQRLMRCVGEFVEPHVSEMCPHADAVVDPADFELLCQEMLRQAGWDARRIGGGGDQGADIIASRNGMMAVFQCKLYAEAVGNSAVQEVHAAKSFYRANLAAVIARNGYTRAAKQVADSIGVFLLDVNDIPNFRGGPGPAGDPDGPDS